MVVPPQPLWFSKAIPTVTSAATKMPMTQPRTVRNLVHSAHSSGPNPADPLDMPGACDAHGRGSHRAAPLTGSAR